jgi:hypothetical protein
VLDGPEVMRPRTFYGLPMAPGAAWLAAHVPMSLWVESLGESSRPGAIASAVLATYLWSLRVMPFAVVGAAVSAPMVMVAGALLIRPGSRPEPSMRMAAPWALLWSSSWAAAITLALALPDPPIGLILFAWSGVLAQCIVVAIAYRVQKALHARGASLVRGGALLTAAVLLSLLASLPGILVALWPTWLEWRVEVRGRPTKG